MTNFNRYLLCVLFALFACWFTTAGSAPSAETGRADLHPLRASHNLVSLGNPQLNTRLSKGKFLVASRQLTDPRFTEAVILLIQHDSNGTVGLIVNRPTKLKLADLVPDIKEQPGREHVTYIGGPVGINQVFLLIRSQNKPEESERIFDDIYVSVSRSVLEQLIKKPAGKETFRAYAGYAGWGAGQLEREVLMGGWQVTGADAETIFKKPSSEIWQDLNRENEPGHIDI